LQRSLYADPFRHRNDPHAPSESLNALTWFSPATGSNLPLNESMDFSQMPQCLTLVDAVGAFVLVIPVNLACHNRKMTKVKL
jgi:hypothetical protein